MDCNSELESGKIGGGDKSKSRKGLKEILHDLGFTGKRWNIIFTMSCALAIFIDPLYCYVPVIHHRGNKCLELEKSLLWTYTGLRSAVDVFYAIDFLISLPRIRREPQYCSQNTVLGSKWDKLFTERGHKLLQVLYIILVGFPLPEVREAPFLSYCFTINSVCGAETS